MKRHSSSSSMVVPEQTFIVSNSTNFKILKYQGSEVSNSSNMASSLVDYKASPSSNLMSLDHMIL
jgi:hypothetical protein